MQKKDLGIKLEQIKISPHLLKKQILFKKLIGSQLGIGIKLEELINITNMVRQKKMNKN